MEYQKQQFSTAKQQLSAVQLNIKHALKEDAMPMAEDIAQFIAMSEEMCALSKPEWQDAMDQYKAVLVDFEAAVAKGDQTQVADIFHRIIEGKESCHKKYRKPK